jgi:hypothetical protein
MTETDWLTSTTPSILLSGLPLPTSQRKLRLFACACTRQVKHLLTDARSHEALELCERFASSPRLPADFSELDEASGAARAATEAVQGLLLDHPTEVIWRAHETAAVAVLMLTRYEGVELARIIDTHVANALRDEAFAREVRHDPGLLDWGESALEREERQQASLAALTAGQIADAVRADLLRDIFGNPWRREAIDPSALTWNAGTVHHLAQHIYDERRFSDMNILADALLDAGCTSENLVSHCRTPKPHVRGCWVIDALLQKS